MYTLANLKPAKGATKGKKRIGRGNASGHGTYSGRGMKGQRARSGGKGHSPIEGGRTPLVQQIPKMRGFKAVRPQAETVTLATLMKHFKAGETVDKKALFEKGIISAVYAKCKIVGNTQVNKTLIIAKNIRISEGAKKILEAAGATLEV